MNKLFQLSFVFFLWIPQAFSAQTTDRPAIHGMLMVGSKKVYLSHLPMFHGPHDYQAILEVTLTAAHRDPQAVYVEDRLRTGEPIYTLVPDEVFVLPAMVQKQGSFAATIYRGHFERGGVPIVQGVTVSIREVIHFEKFNVNVQALSELQYLFFGNSEEQFVAHKIAKCPDYDQVLEVQTTHAVASSHALEVRIPGRFNSEQLIEAEVVKPLAPTGLNVGPMRIVEQFYLERGDLACMNQ